MRLSKYKMFKVMVPGLFTTVQDSGRYGFQKFGVPVTGALDSFSAGIANDLVGNATTAALLECTLLGPKLLVMENAYIAITGAEMRVTCNSQEVPQWEAFRVCPGDILEIGQAQSGCRGYLAVTGGIEVPLVMGSRSTYVGAKIGGYQGRALKEGDILDRGIGKLLPAPQGISDNLLPKFSSEIVLRAIPGPQDDYFEEGLELFFSSEFKVSPEANRMGYRLKGATVKQKPGMPASIISESSLPGGVQIPPNGQPIILLVEQTVGGYSKIATVISSDLHLVAQALPGDCIRFEQVSLETACSIRDEQLRLIDTLQSSIEKTGRENNSRIVANMSENSALHRYEELYPECCWSG